MAAARAQARARLRGRTDPPSDQCRPTHTVEQFGLTGPSDPPDPRTHAYRKDLADAALAGRVIASHYAEPVRRVITAATELRGAPSAGSEVIAELTPGSTFDMLDDSLGWAWGYAVDGGLVGYVSSDAVGKTAEG